MTIAQQKIALKASQTSLKRVRGARPCLRGLVAVGHVLHTEPAMSSGMAPSGRASWCRSLKQVPECGGQDCPAQHTTAAIFEGACVAP